MFIIYLYVQVSVPDFEHVHVGVGLLPLGQPGYALLNGDSVSVNHNVLNPVAVTYNIPSDNPSKATLFLYMILLDG